MTQHTPFWQGDLEVYDLARLLNVFIGFAVIGLILGLLRSWRSHPLRTVVLEASLALIVIGAVAGSVQGVLHDAPLSISTVFFTPGLIGALIALWSKPRPRKPPTRGAFFMPERGEHDCD